MSYSCLIDCTVLWWSYYRVITTIFVQVVRPSYLQFVENSLIYSCLINIPMIALFCDEVIIELAQQFLYKLRDQVIYNLLENSMSYSSLFNIDCDHCMSCDEVIIKLSQQFFYN